MSEHAKVIKNAFGTQFDIVLDEFYYISYSDQQQKLTEAQYKEKYKKYLGIINWPETAMKFRALAELHPEESPRYIKITGRMIMEWCEKGFVPQFDKYFNKTRRLVMIPIEAYDHFNKHSYMLRDS